MPRLELTRDRFALIGFSFSRNALSQPLDLDMHLVLGLVPVYHRPPNSHSSHSTRPCVSAGHFAVVMPSNAGHNSVWSCTALHERACHGRAGLAYEADQ